MMHNDYVSVISKKRREKFCQNYYVRCPKTAELVCVPG